MRAASALAVAFLAALAAPVTALAQQPNYGCLASANCGQKGNSPAVGPRDYWQNWICGGCHIGPVTNYVPSPAERALLSVPARFWVMHTEAERDGETRARVSQHRLVPTSRMAPAFQQLMANRPKAR
jgi:hypothetical protein